MKQLFDQFVDALALPFIGILLAHLRAALGAATNAARATARLMWDGIGMTVRFAMGAALKPALGAFLALFVVLSALGVLSTRIAGIETPEVWQDVIAFTVVVVVMLSIGFFVYVWDNRALPTGEVERVRRQMATVPAADIVAREAMAAQINTRLENEFGGRAPVVFFLLFAATSFLALGFEFVLLSVWHFRWENDLSWAASVWTALVGCVALYVGARTLKAPFMIAAVIAKGLDEPIDWAFNFMARNGLAILPGITSDNAESRVTFLNVPLEKAAAAFRTFGNGVISAIRWMIGVTLVALNIVWMGGALIIGFVIGLGRVEQEEIARLDTHPQVVQSVWRFWGPRGAFVVGIIGRVVWMLVSTPAHAATAPTGPGTTVVEDATNLAHAAPTVTIPTVPGFSLSGFSHDLATLGWWKLLSIPATLLAVLVVIALIAGTLKELSSEKTAIPGKVAWAIVGLLTLLVAAPLVIFSFVAQCHSA